MHVKTHRACPEQGDYDLNISIGTDGAQNRAHAIPLSFPQDLLFISEHR